MKVRCPLCKEWVLWENNPHRPFCSEACRQKDLGAWATEKYRVPVEEPDAGEPLLNPARSKDEYED